MTALSDLKPNPTAEELEAYKKRIKAIKQREYDKCSEKVYRLCSKIHQHQLQISNGSSVDEIYFGANSFYTLRIEDVGGGDAYVIKDANDVILYSDLALESHAATYSNRVSNWYSALTKQYKIAESFFRNLERERIQAQYGELLAEIKSLSLDHLPDAFTPDLAVGEEAIWNGSLVKVEAVDCDSAEYTVRMIASSWDETKVIKFWQVKPKLVKIDLPLIVEAAE